MQFIKLNNIFKHYIYNGIEFEIEQRNDQNSCILFVLLAGKTIEPPTKQNIDGALSRLQDVGAVDKSYGLTALGRHLAALPVDVRVGKLILLGAIFCCVDSALTMAAFLSHKSPFVAPFGKKVLCSSTLSCLLLIKIKKKRIY